MKFGDLTIKDKRVSVVLFVLAGLLLFYLFFGVLYKKWSKNTKETKNMETQSVLPPKFSRITFFHTAKPICTLAIPEEWEGKYRMQDAGGAAHFLYIEEVGNPELFYIKKYDKSNKIKNENEKMIWENKSFVYVLGLSTRGSEKIVNKEEYAKMIKDLDEITKTFKCF